jgi:hypothetical protein
MPPVRLTDLELDAVLAAARPLPIRLRDSFLQEVAARLSVLPVLGAGVVSRICREVQAAYFDPPQLSDD